MKLIINGIEVTGTVDECIEFIKKYNEIYLPIITPNSPDIPQPWNPGRPYVTWEHPYVGGWDGDQPYGCEGCAWNLWEKDKYKLGDMWIGDTPCTWCPKRQPTCGDTSISGGSYTSVADKNVTNINSKCKADK